MNSNGNYHVRPQFQHYDHVSDCNVQTELETLKRLYVLLLAVNREWQPAPTFPLFLLRNPVAIIAKF